MLNLLNRLQLFQTLYFDFISSVSVRNTSLKLLEELLGTCRNETRDTTMDTSTIGMIMYKINVPLGLKR